MAIGVGLLFVALALLAVFEPALPGRWCETESQWRVCYREWLGSISGWAAIVAAAVALAATRQQILQEREIADREYRQMMRGAHLLLLERVDKLYKNVVTMRASGAAGRQISGDFQATFMLDDAELGRLEQVTAFREGRLRAFQEAQAFQRAADLGHVTEKHDALVKTLAQIHEMLDRGMTISEIAKQLE
jgi:hypothetical protein